MANKALIAHFDIEENDSCRCTYCADWKAQKGAMVRTKMLFEAKRCKCKNCAANPNNTLWLCLNYQKAQYALLEAANRRELVIEMSYHATFGDEQDGNELMEWVDNEIQTNVKHGVGWWALHSERMSMDDWFVMFDTYCREKAKRILENA